MKLVTYWKSQVKIYAWEMEPSFASEDIELSVSA